MSWTAVGNISFSAFQWMLVVLIARLGGPGQVGQFAAGIAVTTPVFLLSNLGLRTTLSTDIGRQYPLFLYFAIRFMSSCIAFVAALAIALVIGYRGAILLTCVMLACYRFIESLSDVAYGHMQLNGWMREIAISQIVRAMCSVAIIVLIVGRTGSLNISLLAMTIVSVLSFKLYDVRHLGRGNERSSEAVNKESWDALRRSARTLVSASLPIGLAMTLASLELNVPRIIVERGLGMEALGVFSVVTSVAVVASVFMSSISQAILPGLAQRFASGQVAEAVSLISRLAMLVGVISVVCTIGVYLVGSSLLTLLYGEEFAEYSSILVVVVLAMAIGAQGWLLNALLIASRNPTPIAKVSLVSLVFVVIATAAVVGQTGLMGVAWVLVLSSVIQVAIKLMVIVRLIHELNSTSEVGLQCQ